MPTISPEATATGLSPVTGGLSAPLANVAEREWAFPGADDVFRGIYMRSCNNDREILAANRAQIERQAEALVGEQAEP